MEMQGWEHFDFTSGGICHPIFKSGQGPGVLIMHELPGMTPQCINFANRIKAAGFCAYLPLFFGRPGERLSLLSGGLSVLRLCVLREFYCLAANRTSPISDWLRHLCRKIYGECGGNGVGAIGMCLTGNLVIPLMLEPYVLAPITCQPALPFAITAGLRVAVGISSNDLLVAATRSQSVPLHGYRFSTDRLCPVERFDALAKMMGNGFVGITIPTGPNNPGNINRNAHSVFTEDFVNDPAHPTYKQLESLLAHFKNVLS